MTKQFVAAFSSRTILVGEGEIHTSNIEAIFPSSPSRGGAKRQVSVLDPL